MNKKYFFYIVCTLVLTFIFIITFYNYSFCAYPKLVSKLISGFESVKTWIIKIATPAAAVAVRKWNFYEEV